MSEKEQPALPSSAEAPHNNPSHLLIVLAPPEIVTDVTEEIHYEDLAVIGAAPVQDREINGEAESAVSALAADHLKNTKGTVTVHVASFTGQNFDPDAVIAYLDNIEELEDKLDFQTVPLESVSGLRAYLEEFVRLTPEDPAGGAESYQSVVPGTGTLDPDIREELMGRLSEIEESHHRTMGLAPGEDDDDPEEDPEPDVPEEDLSEKPNPLDADPPAPMSNQIPIGFCWVTRAHIFNIGEISRVTYGEESCVVETAHHGKFDLQGDDANVFVSTFLR